MADPLSPQAGMTAGMAAGTGLFGIAMRNLQAVAAAQQSFMEGTRLLVQQQTAIANALIRAAPTPQSLAKPTDAAAGIDALITGLKDAQAASNELSDLVLRNAGNVTAILQDRLFAALDEMKTIARTATPKL